MIKRCYTILRYLSVTAAIPLCIQTSNATTWFEKDFVCPIGGEKFTSKVVGSNSTWGARPDGKPYGSLSIYPLIECPENGFIIFKEDWTDQELDILKKAIATVEFEKIWKAETQYYRLWWLQSKITQDPITLASNLLTASWESDKQIRRKQKYQNLYIAEVKKIVQEDDPESWFWLNLRSANIMRELGQFAQSIEHFKFIESNIPQKIEDEIKDYFAEYIASQRQLIKEENKASEPANMVGENNAIWRCIVHKAELTASELPICNSDTLKQSVDRIKLAADDGTKLEGEAAILYVAKKNREF